MSETTNQSDSIKKLGELIADINIAMLTTIDEDGSLRSRPMGTQETEFDGHLWFFTSDRSAKVDEIGKRHQVNVSYAAPAANTFVSVSGEAEVVQDKAKIEELWSPALKAWFPDGPETPDIALLRVDVEKAEYWDAPNSKMVILAGFLKAVVTGQRYDPGENEKVKIS